MDVRPQRSALSRGAIIGYGVGEFAFGLTFTFCTLFLLYFYTDVLGLSPTTGGLIIMVALIWEGITDPLVGFLANKTTTRWGRYRPYLLLGGVPLGLSFVAMFLPLQLGGSALAAYALASHLLFRTVFTFVNIPYLSLSAQITTDSLTRGYLAAARMLSTATCGLLIAIATLPAVALMGGGRAGFFGVSLAYACLAATILVICFFSTRETVQSAAHQRLDLRQTIRAISVNRPFQLVFAATLLASVGYTMCTKSLIYYVKYSGGSEQTISFALTVFLASGAVAILPWMGLMRRTSKRRVWLTAVVISTAAALATYLIAPSVGLALWLLIALFGFGNAGFLLTFWAMVPDTVEYGELKAGMRVEGALVGMVSFSQKVALGLGTGLVGVLLDAIGYMPNAAQNASTMRGILMMFTLVPLILALGGAILIFFYPLDQATHRRIVAIVARRREHRSELVAGS